MSYQDLGEKAGEPDKPSKEPKIYYPSITVKNDYGPEWTDEPFDAKIQLRFTGFDKGADDKSYSCRFDIQKIDLSQAPYKDDEEKKSKKSDWQMKERGKEMGIEVE